MSSPNGSLANLLVTRKSLDASDNRTPLTRNLGSPFPVPFRGANDRRGGTNKKASAEGAGMSRIKSRRRTGAGNGLKDFLAANRGETIA
jgi:hypothetical protein